MGDVIKVFPVRSSRHEKPVPLRMYFDSGSPYTFIRMAAARRFRGLSTLPEPMDFAGLGEGRFYASHGLFFEVRLLIHWCRHSAYVVDDEILAEDYDVLVGHDFMQKFNVGLSPKKRDVVLDPSSLRLAQTVRRTLALGAAAGS